MPVQSTVSHPPVEEPPLPKDAPLYKFTYYTGKVVYLLPLTGVYEGHAVVVNSTNAGDAIGQIWRNIFTDERSIGKMEAVFEDTEILLKFT